MAAYFHYVVGCQDPLATANVSFLLISFFLLDAYENGVGEANTLQQNPISEVENLKSKGLNLGLGLITITYMMAILEANPF